MKPQGRDAARLQEILSEFYAGGTSRDEARSAVIDVVLARQRCARVSLWKFAGEGDGLSLVCFAAKTSRGVLEAPELRLCRPEYRDYFNGLIERGIYMSRDAMRDPALQPMRESYLLPNHVVSMLDAAFLLNGRAYGMICCEETAARAWSAADVTGLRAIVVQLALIMSGAPESALWQSPSMPLDVLPAGSPGSH